MQIEVKYKLVIEPGKEFELTEKQARALQAQLNSLFGNQKESLEEWCEMLKKLSTDDSKPPYPTHPPYVPPQTHWLDIMYKNPQWTPPSWTVECKSKVISLT